MAIAIYLEGIRDYQNGMVKTLSAHADARAGIFAVVDYHLRWVSRNPAWARFLFEYRHAEFMSDAEDAMKGLNTEFSKGMGEWFGRHIQAGDLKRLPKDVIIALLLGPCQEFSRLYIAGHAETAVPEASQAIAEGAWISLKRDA